jgi:hypothetical protein
MTVLTLKENELHNRLIVAEFNLGQVEEELRRLDEVNAELVEALSVVIRGVPDTWEGVQKAKAVLNKAKENNHG